MKDDEMCWNCPIDNPDEMCETCYQIWLAAKEHFNELDI